MWKFVAVPVVVVLFFTISFMIGWAARRCQKNSNAAFTSTLHNLLSEIKSENIRNFLRNFTKLPHLSGTEQNLRLARQMQAQWKEFGLDSAELVHYDVLLSYPNTSNPNYISIIDGDGTEIFNTTLSEPIPEGYENVEDIVPPYNAFSAQGEPEGELVYVNYARIEDFIKLKRDLKVNCTGKIAIARYGKIFRGNKVKNAMDAGAIGLILFSDPADYCAPGVDVYPKGWNLPGGGAQRGNVLNLNGAGDPLTPGYPAKEYTYRCAADKGAGLPKIPVHPIGYDDAVQLLRNIGGLESSSDWKGSLNVSYNIGPGFKDNSTDKVRMHIYTNNNVTRIYNVIGKIRGAVEPDRYIILGGHRDSWVFGGIDPTSGAAVLHEVARSAGTLVKKGWRPRRTIIFASWDAEEFGLLGSTEWAEENAKLLQERGVAYVNADSAVEGNYTLRVDCTPLFYNLVYDLAKKIASPDNGYKDKTLYDSWFQKDPWTKYNPSVPKINKLGSGSDFEAYFQRLGLASGRTRYTKNSKTDKYSNYPVYHSVYETFELVEKFYDPTFNQHRAVAQMRAGWVYELADRPVLPFNATDYAKALKSYVEEISNVAKEKQFDVSFDSLFSAVDNFTEAATEFHQRLSKLDTNNPIALRIMNDQMMYLERAFVDPLGLPGRPFYRHIIYAPSSYNKYAGISFPGIYDALFEIESEHDQQKALNEVRRQISVATFAVQAAGETLREVA